MSERRLGYTAVGLAYRGPDLTLNADDRLWVKEMHNGTGIYTFDCKIAICNAKGNRHDAAVALLNAYPTAAALIAAVQKDHP